MTANAESARLIEAVARIDAEASDPDSAASFNSSL
jgi:hypothetical protein